MRIGKYIILLMLSVSTTIWGQKRLVIVHTNDTHSQIEPIEKNAPKEADKGGIARREVLMNQLRAEEPNLLFFDVGDFCQGTPYFNKFKGEIEVKSLNLLRYDAVTIGNHEFDNGIEPLAKILKMAKFPVVCANYDFGKTKLSKIIVPYTIIERGGLKVGVIGIGVKLEGLVAIDNYSGITYLDPIETANKWAAYLKSEKSCDIVVVLSHLGYSYPEEGGAIGDCQLAAKSRNIDVILGGHSHTFLKKETIVENLDHKKVVINQAGKWAVEVDKLELEYR